MRRFFLFWCLWLVVSPSFAATGMAAAFYYGPDIPWGALRAYDYAVVEPDQAAAVPERFRAQRYYAYVSLGEVLPERHYFSAIQSEWRLGKNPDWGSFVLDQSRPALHKLFIEQVITPLWEQGYRGFFFDTLDSYQLVVNDETDRLAQREGLAALINAISRQYPEARFILNRGFELLPMLTVPVDAIAAESLVQRWLPSQRRYQAVPDEDREWLLGQFRQVRDKYGVDTIAIDYAPANDRDQARSIARKIAGHGVIPWVTNPALDVFGLGVREVMPRKVLLVYGGTDERRWEDSAAIRYGLMPLQFQGLVPDLRSITDSMPAGNLKGRYAGIVTWLQKENLASESFQQWLDQQRQWGVPIVMIGHSAVDPAGAHGENFGFETRPVPASPPKVVTQNPALGFEMPLPKLIELGEALDNSQVRAPWLKLTAGNNDYMPVAMTEWGGYAFDPFVIRSLLPGVDKKGLERWMLNPLTFIREGLKLPAMPIPDVTTENGRRLVFAHMDGDGFPSLAEVKGYQGKTDALVLLEQILQKFTLPTTISVIEGEIADHGIYPKMAPQLQRVARQMFALPHVEAATHTYSHPFFWYDAQANPGALYGPEGQLRLPLPGYKMDPQREVAGSARYIDEHLLPKGKKTKMVLWSGDTVPTPEALKAAREHGLLNMNGSDTVITKSSPTWTLIKGIGLPKGDEFQVYAPNQNENVYTNDWSGPFYGFERVLETFELTETPYRFKPVDIYYHTYIASKNASLESLRRVYQWAEDRPLFPLFASEYVRKVLDFNDMVVVREGNGWRVIGNGELRTVRLPEALGLPDLSRSEGVVGYRQDKPGRYVHLLGGVAAWQEGNNTAPYLQQANGRITQFSRTETGFEFALHGYKGLEFTIANARGCALKQGERLLSGVNRGQQRIQYRSRQHELTELRLHCQQ